MLGFFSESRLALQDEVCLEVNADPATALAIMTKMNSNAPLGVADVPCPAPSAPSVPELAGEGGDAVSEKPGQKKDPKENTKKDEKNRRSQRKNR